ncbi:glycosyltransferase family 4 protein [Halocalculus aciditolerans]|uniref:Glycosyltransferase n=1 Tax=Halocalculus aciditolerans TaxID=1383812 RepID=A0A830F3I1_9EURY|nr:glycosyltransferase family 4 protein [Halocalculus aciditolerans]GGL59528.1 hypothetical protein GCM10009039_17180 [Halocalculus aciditolerans]
MGTPRVCFVVNSVSETSVPASIAAAINEYTDATVDILSWFSAGEFTQDPSLKIRNINAPDSFTGISRASYARAKTILREYDLIQAHHNHSGSFAKIIGRRLGIPVISREGNTRDGFTREGRILNGLTNPLCEFVVCNSTAVRDSFKQWESVLLSSNSVRIIPNGIDEEQISNALANVENPLEGLALQSESIVVGTASSLTTQKGLDTLINAIALANTEADSPFELVVAGDGPLREELERLAREKEVENSVHLLGSLERAEVYQMMDNTDIYAMPSRWEGFANAAVEALGIGNACVFSDIAPFSEPYEQVALFHPVDDHESLATKLREFGENADLRREYAERGRNLVREKYTLPEIAARYEALYNRALS